METTTHTNAPTTTAADTLLLTLDEAARELRCARRSIERQIARRRLTVVHVGRSVRVERRELERFIAAFQQGRVPEPTPTYVAGFKQWLSLNRHVMKGQSGYAILAPVTARFASSTPQNAESWRRLGRGEKPGNRHQAGLSSAPSLTTPGPSCS